MSSSTTPPRSPSKVDSILFNGDNGPASQLLNNSNISNDHSNSNNDSKDGGSSGSDDDDDDDDPTEEGEDQSNPFLVDNILKGPPETPPRSSLPSSSSALQNDPQQQQQQGSEQHKSVHFGGVDSPTSLPRINVQQATRSELYQRLDFMEQRLTQAQIDLSGEKALRKRKEKNLMKLAKELSRRQKQSEKHESQIVKMAGVVQTLETKLAKAEEEGGNKGDQQSNGNNSRSTTSTSTTVVAVATATDKNHANIHAHDDAAARMIASVKQEAETVSAGLRQQVVQANQEAERLRSALTHVNREVDRFRSAMASANREADRLRSAMIALEKKNKELEMMKNITAQASSQKDIVVEQCTMTAPKVAPVSTTLPSSLPQSPVSSSPLSFLLPTRKKLAPPTVSITTSITSSGSSSNKSSKTAYSSDVRFVTLATVLAGAALIWMNREMFQLNAMCAPAMPGTLLPPMKLFKDHEDNSKDNDDKGKGAVDTSSLFAAPWWAPAFYKDAAFEAFCKGHGHAQVELKWQHENNVLSATNMSSGKSLMRKSMLAGAKIGAKHIVLTSQTGATEEIVAPWAI